MAEKRKVEGCFCQRSKQIQVRRKKGRDYKRKRQNFVFNVNPDEEIWHEPYMQCLRKEFSNVSILCDSKIELPWKDIALPAAARKIRADSSAERGKEGDAGADETEVETEKRESIGVMILPWNDLIINNAVIEPKTVKCDSTVEIPWNDIAWERPADIKAPLTEEQCEPDDVEIPWNDILVPQNIVIENPKIKQHPSSKLPPRKHGRSTNNTRDPRAIVEMGGCIGCTVPCCARKNIGASLTKSLCK